MDKELDHKNTILLVLLGNSPPVITEAAYIAARKYEYSGTLKVVTTATSRDLADRSEVGDQLDRLNHDLHQTDNTLYPEKITWSWDGKYHIPVSVTACGKKREVDDINDDEKHEIFTNFLLNLLRDEKQKGKRVIACVAGGRKNMSVDLLTCMSWSADESDHLFHIILTDEEKEF